MRLFYRGKDGGPESKTWSYWLVEWKWLFSIALLRFEQGSREAFHSHAFNAISWLLSGRLIEENNPSLCSMEAVMYTPSWRPIITPRSRFHKVSSVGRSWAITFRGPWAKTWKEYLPVTGESYKLSSGRVKV